MTTKSVVAFFLLFCLHWQGISYNVLQLQESSDFNQNQLKQYVK